MIEAHTNVSNYLPKFKFDISGKHLVLTHVYFTWRFRKTYCCINIFEIKSLIVFITAFMTAFY